MASIGSASDYLNARTSNPDDLFFYKDGRLGAAASPATIAGFENSLWLYDGIPVGGVVLGGGGATIPTNTTPGGLQQVDPSGGRQKWLCAIEAAIVQNAATTQGTGILTLYDRLLHKSGLDGTNTGAQTVQSGGSPALTRYTDGYGNEMFLEINTQIGASSTTVTASYTDENGNTHTTQAVAIGNTGFREKTRLIRLPKAAGDKGVKAMASVTLAATTGTAGDIGVVIAHPLVEIDIQQGSIAGIRSLMSGQPGPVEILTDACLAWTWLARGTAVPAFIGALHMAEK